MNSINHMSSDDVSPTYCTPDPFNRMRDSAIIDGPMSNGLGISQSDNQAHNMLNQDFQMGNHMSMESLGIAMQPQLSQQRHNLSNQDNTDDDDDDDENNRRTLTQDQFDIFGNAHPNAFMPSSTDQSLPNVSATITNPAEIYGEYDFPDLCDFTFDDPQSDAMTSIPMQPSHSTDSYVSTATTHSDHLPSLSLPAQPRTSSASSDGSTPSVSITPAQQEADANEYAALPAQTSQAMATQHSTGAQWQPGQSIPVDLAALQQEFEVAAMRNRTQSVPHISHLPAQHQFLEQPLAYPLDEAYSRRESSTTQLARSMQNFTMAGQRSAMPSATIAARRQRPKPAPLGGASLRSSSYCGQLPTSPGPVAGGQKSQTGGQSLRRIKSSQTMNGIANGRIQKNIGSAQRSPSGVAFADVANAGRYARRVSAFAGLQAQSAGLPPPTPMSPSSYANLQSSIQNMRQASISGSDGDAMNNVISSNNFSPPSTPIYTALYPRGRLGSAAITENTPPQSAPATQQSFPTSSYSQAGSMSHGQSSIPPVPMLQSQPHGFVPMMSNEYPPMPNAGYSNQMQQQQQQQQPLSNNYMDMPVSYIMTNTGEVHMGYALVPPPYAQQQMHNQSNQSHNVHPFLPSSNSSPGVMVSSQVPKQSNQAADFFVHEYTPPQDVKQAITPRKATDTGPKNYTFSNHGPEYFERNVKKEDCSPTSSAGGSLSA